MNAPVSLPPTLVFIVNGFPRAGKDTLTQFMDKALTAKGYTCSHFSSIDPVRNVLSRLGISTKDKTAADRKLLATIGAAVEEHSNYRSKCCLDHVQWAALTTKKPVVFLMIREPEVIEWVKTKLEDRGHMVFRLWVESIRQEAPTNPTDRSAGQMPFDIAVMNNGTLQDLAQEAQALVNLIHMRREVRHAV